MGLRLYFLGLSVLLAIAEAAPGTKLYPGNHVYMLDHPYGIFNADPVSQYVDDQDDDLFQARNADDDDDADSELGRSKLSTKSLGKNIVAVGSSLNKMAALVPASPAILQAAGVNPRHIIGYIPVSSPDGNALVFPTGAIRILGNKYNNHNEEEEEDDEEEDEEERGIGNRRNPMKKYAKRRSNSSRYSNRRKSSSRRRGYRPLSGRTRSKSRNSNRYTSQRGIRRRHYFRYRVNRN